MTLIHATGDQCSSPWRFYTAPRAYHNFLQSKVTVNQCRREETLVLYYDLLVAQSVIARMGDVF